MWKIRYRTLGAHTHCSLFWKQDLMSTTWAKCGDFVIDHTELSSLRRVMPGVAFQLWVPKDEK